MAQPVVYVDAGATGANDGSSWTDAYANLQAAFDAAEASGGSIREIWVADGTYKPSKRTNPDDPRSATFQLIDGVSLYGGFAGTEAFVNERNIDANPTILSGDFNGDDQPDFANYGENASHVVTARSVGTLTVFDGFTVTGGNAIGPTYATERGAGMYLDEAYPLIRNCVFKRNFAGRELLAFPYASGGGAGVYAQVIDWYEATPILSFFNCRFTENTTVGDGGGVYLYQTAAEFGSCSFAQNEAKEGGGGAAFYEVDQVVVDASRFDRNSAGGAAAFSFSGGTLTVTDSVFSYNYSTGNGGALAARSKDSIAITDSEFVGNRGEFGGGGFITAYYQGAAIVRTRFVGNEANFHGGGLLIESGRLEMTDCEFEQNTARRLAGCFYLYDGDATVRRVSFWGNRARDGGAMASEWGSAAIADSTFSGNYANVGGAIHITSPELFDFDRCQFTGNSAEIGGGIAALGFNSSTQIGNSLLANNEASAYGGAVAGGTGNLSVLNSTIAHNLAGALGGGMIVGRNTAITNSIVWGNLVGPYSAPWTDEHAQIDGIEFAEIDYSDVQGWSGTYGGAENIGDDPRFIDPFDPENPWRPQFDFHLRPESPCINAGLTETVDPGPWDLPPPNLDLDGKPRVLCNAVDMGAYEFGLMGDVDCNLRVDLHDFSLWSQCAFGPGAPGLCPAFDADGDGDVDLRDFAEFVLVLSPASP